MKGYLTKHQKGYTLTIVDNSEIKHHFIIRSMEKFSKRFLKEEKEKVFNRRGIGQYIVDKLGFGFDCELDLFDRYSFVSP
jgi:hypothetical protein